MGTDDENEVDQKGSDYTTSLLKKKRTGCCCCSSVGRCQKRRAWHLVTVYVFSPAETVNDGKTRSRCTLGGVGVLAVLVVLLLVWFWNSRWVMQKSGRPLFWFNCLCLMTKKPQMTRQARDKHTRHNQGIRPTSKERDCVSDEDSSKKRALNKSGRPLFWFVSAAWHASPSCCRTARCLVTARGGTAQPVPAPGNISV